MKKTIGIDCRLAGEENAGIGRYVSELVSRLVKDSSVNWVLFFSHAEQILLPKYPHVRTVIVPIRQYSVAEQIFLPCVFLLNRLDLLHVPHYNVPILYPGPTVVTIHDLLWHAQKDPKATTLSPFVHRIKYFFYKIVVSRAIARARTLFVPSRITREQLLHYYPQIDAAKILVTKEGVSEIYRQKEQRKKREDILFYTGSLYPHKNISIVIHALEDLPAYTLHISSARGVFLDELKKSIREFGMDRRVVFHERLSDQELAAWYAKSFALVQPSLSEGFGLTGLEAMASGLPVLASKIPIFDEIYKDAYVSFDPHDAKSFLTAVEKLSNHYAEYAKRGHILSKSYSWDTCAQETKKYYA